MLQKFYISHFLDLTKSMLKIMQVWIKELILYLFLDFTKTLCFTAKLETNCCIISWVIIKYTCETKEWGGENKMCQWSLQKLAEGKIKAKAVSFSSDNNVNLVVSGEW